MYLHKKEGKVLNTEEIEVSYSIRRGVGARNHLIVKMGGKTVHKKPIIDGGEGLNIILWSQVLLGFQGYETDQDIMKSFDSEINGRCITFRRVQ